MKIGTEELCDKIDIFQRRNKDVAERNDVFVLEVLEQLELTVCALCEHRCAERLHDLLDCDILVGKLIPGRTNEAKSSHANRLEIGVSRGDLECGAKDLGAYELGHGEYVIFLDERFEGEEKK